MSVERDEWWLAHTNIAALYRWLVENDEIDERSTADVCYFLQKPWKWTPEWQRMQRGEEAHNG
jgi:hypothetical protein